VMLSLSSAPVLKGDCNCGSPKMQELLHDVRWWEGMGTDTLKSIHGLPMWILNVSLFSFSFHFIVTN